LRSETCAYNHFSTIFKDKYLFNRNGPAMLETNFKYGREC
jgi:hypothetical protein